MMSRAITARLFHILHFTNYLFLFVTLIYLVTFIVGVVLYFVHVVYPQTLIVLIC